MDLEQPIIKEEFENIIISSHKIKLLFIIDPLLTTFPGQDLYFLKKFTGRRQTN